MSSKNSIGCRFESMEARQLLSGDVGDLRTEADGSEALLLPAVYESGESTRQSSKGHEQWIELISVSMATSSEEQDLGFSSGEQEIKLELKPVYITSYSVSGHG